MTGTFNSLLSLIKQFLTGLGIEDSNLQVIMGFLALVSLILLFARQIWLGIKYLLERRRKKLLAKDLHPFFTRYEVEQATRYYVPTRYQNVPPSNDDEPGRNYISAARQPLIPLFLNKAFKNDADDNKFYLVLADSGMGKTTFMINLYLSYKYKRTRFWQSPKHDIKLFPMGHPHTIETIKGMSSEEKQNSILLLDAFDEDNKAVENYATRLQEILDLVWEFREVVITCRTQFFPSAKDEPTETGKFKFGGDGGQYHFQKVYVSVFSDDDIAKYLKKKFQRLPFFKGSNFNKALAIVLKSPNLMIRPMLLSHIDDLIDTDSELKYEFQIYETLIEQWLIRESNKAGIQKKYGMTYQSRLYNFSRALARDLYLNRKVRNNRLSLRVDELIDNPGGLQLKDIEGNLIEIDQYDQRSRTLLNRNADGEYKFSHKSIFEYFLALEVINNREFKKSFYFQADLDTAKRFFLEMFIEKSRTDRDTKAELLPVLFEMDKSTWHKNRRLRKSSKSTSSFTNLGISVEEVYQSYLKEYKKVSTTNAIKTYIRPQLKEFLFGTVFLILAIPQICYSVLEIFSGSDYVLNIFGILFLGSICTFMIYSVVGGFKEFKEKINEFK